MSTECRDRRILWRYTPDAVCEVDEVRSWAEGFQQSIEYMERNMADSLKIEDIAADAKSDPAKITSAPQNTIVSRPDETRAARELILKGE